MAKTPTRQVARLRREVAHLDALGRAAVAWWDAVSMVTPRKQREAAYVEVGLAMGALPNALLRRLERPPRRAGGR